jgi:hypothetical protein
MLERFEEQLKVHQVFWDVMDLLDRETWVLEPQQPKPDSICRRIVVCKAFSNCAHSVANFFCEGLMITSDRDLIQERKTMSG